MPSKEAQTWCNRYFGAHLAELRSSHRLTQKDLAKATGYSEAQVSHVESGRRAANADYLVAVATPLETTDDALRRAQATFEAAWLWVHPAEGDLPLFRRLFGWDETNHSEIAVPDMAARDLRKKLNAPGESTVRDFGYFSVPALGTWQSRLRQLQRESTTLSTTQLDQVLAFIAGLRAAED